MCDAAVVSGRLRVAVVVAALVGLSGCAATSVAERPVSTTTVTTTAMATPTATPTATRTATPTATRTTATTSPYADLAPAEPTTDLRTMTVAQLPAEGIETLELIEQGGPFPYAKDGATFSNREGILPKQPSGFYEEYTVETPGSDDRGARRIVTGDDGSRFYTADHYNSFREVVSE